MFKFVGKISVVVLLLVGSMFVPNDQKMFASGTSYQGSSFEAGPYNHEAADPYGYNSNQNSRYASTNNGIINWAKLIPYNENGKGIQQFWGTPAVDKDGTIYMINQNGLLYAFNSDGSIKWELQLAGRDDRSVIIGEDGTLYVADFFLYAINPDGTIKWVAKAPPGTDTRFSDSAIDKDGTIYVYNDYDYKLYAFNPDGSLKTKSQVSYSTYGKVGTANGAGILISDNGLLYMALASYPNKSLVAFDKNGLIVWSKKYANGNARHTLDEQGNLVVSVKEGIANKIQKLNALTGELIAEKILTATNANYISSPTVDYADGSIYVSFKNAYLQKFLKLDKDLNIIWEKDNFTHTSDIVVDKNGDIIFSTSTGVTKLNSLGEEIWQVNAEQLYGSEYHNSIGFEGAPTIDANGKVYVGVITYKNIQPSSLLQNYTFMSIGDSVIQDYCTYYDMLEQKLDSGTLTEAERLKAIENAEKLLTRLNEYVPEAETVIE